MAPVRTKRIALVSTRIPNYPHRKKDGGAGSGFSGPVIHEIAFDGPALITEGSAEGTEVAIVGALPPEAALTLVDDAGGRFVLTEDNVLVAGPTPTDYEVATQHTVVVRATLGASTRDQPLVVSVVDLTELVDFDLSGLTISEAAAQGALVGALSSAPTGAAFTLTNTAGDRFALSGNNIVRGVTALDHEAAASHDITVRATLGGEVMNKTFTIQVTDVAELTGVSLSANTIAENSPQGTAVGTLSSTPAGATYSLINNAGNRFALTGGNQIVAGSAATDYETATSHVITVRAARMGETRDQNFTIDVTNVNELQNITLTGATVAENTAPGVTVGTLASVPAGATFTLTNSAGNRFAVSGANLVTGATGTNYEAATSHDVTVQATRGADTITRTFTITVTDVVEPLSIDLSPSSITEGAAAGTLVGTLVSEPTGATFTLTDDAGDRFALNAGTIVAGSVATDFETATSHTITVDADLDGVETSRTFTITVNNVAELTDISLSNTTVSESLAQGATVGALTSTPGGATWTLVNNAGNRFALNGNNIVRGTTALDYEAATSHDITVRGTRGGETREETFTITVTDVDEISNITLSANSTPENSAQGAVVGALTSTPTGATFAMTNTAGGRFALSGTNVVRGATALDYENAASHDITIRGTRLGETFDKTFTIDVVNVNELTDIALSAATIAENAVAGSLVGALSSTPAGATFVLTNTDGNRFALNGNNVVRGATALDYEAATSHQIEVEATLGADTRTETFTITVTDVDEISNIALSNATIAENSASGTVVGALSSTPVGAAWTLTDNAGNRFAISGNNLVAGSVATNYEAATSHEVTVRGTRQGETFDRTFTITVTDVDEISNIALSNDSIAENSGAGVVVGALSSTPAGATWTLVDGAANRFAISGNNLVAGSVATNYEAATSHEVTVRGTRQGETFERTFTITVTDVDEISNITLSNDSIAENAAQNAVVGALSSTPAGATWAITDTAGNRFALSGNNVVRGSVALDYEAATSHDITVRGTRQGETFDRTFTITVTNVNELTGIALSNASISEGAAAGATVGALSSTPAGATFTLTDTAGSRFALSGANVVRGATALDYEAATSHQITVQASLGADTRTESFTINVTNVAEVTAIALGSPASLTEQASSGAVVGTLSSTPVGASFTANSAYLTVNGSNQLVKSTNGGNPFPYLEGFPLYDAQDRAGVEITASRGGESLTQTLRFTPVKAANHTLTISVAQQTQTASSNTASPPYVQRELTSSGGPFSYETTIYGAWIGSTRVNPDDYVMVEFGDTWQPVISMKAGVSRPVSVDVYLFHALTNTGGQWGAGWSKTTLTWT